MPKELILFELRPKIRNIKESQLTTSLRFILLQQTKENNHKRFIITLDVYLDETNLQSYITCHNSAPDS